MKLVHVGQNEWMMEDSVIEFPKNKAKRDDSSLDEKVEKFIKSQVDVGRAIDDIMNEVMIKFQAEIMEDIESQPTMPFQVIQSVLEYDGFEVACEVAQSYILENLEDPDAYFNLAYLYEAHEESFTALLSSRECMRLYLQYFPKNFNWKVSKLPWGIMENRPFLRALFQLANVYADNVCFEEACVQGKKLLQLCPNDNLGIREAMIEWYMYTEEYQKIIQIHDDYPEDILANVAFGKTLACCYLGDLEKAEKAWSAAQQVLPEIAHELLKKRHPRPRGLNENAHGMTIGGKEQAYYYWQDMGVWWEKNATAQALIEKKRAAKKQK